MRATFLMLCLVHYVQCETQCKMTNKYEESGASLQFIFDAIDSSVDPCDNFYEFGCGEWIRKANIPAHFASYNRFYSLTERLICNLKLALEKQIYAEEEQFKQIAKQYYHTCMDIESRNKVGASELTTKLNRVGSWPMTNNNLHIGEEFDIYAFQQKIVELFGSRSALFPFYKEQKCTNSSQWTLSFYESMILLNTLEYTDQQSAEAITNYKIRLTKVAALLALDSGYEVPHDLDIQVEQLVEFEKQIAQITPEQANRWDPSLICNEMNISQFQKLIPQMDVARMLNSYYISTAIKPDFEVNVNNPKFYHQLLNLLEKTSKRTIVNYLIWHSIKTATVDLNDAYENIYQDYKFNRYGAKARPRWLHCVRETRDKFEVATDSIYVDQFVEASLKTVVTNMVDDIRNSFLKVIDGLTWMDNATKENAAIKLNGIKKSLAYSDLVLNDSAVDREYQGLLFNKSQSLYRINEMHTRWSRLTNGGDIFKIAENRYFQSAVVNAFYYPSENAIKFPAGILQAPFFHLEYPFEINLSSIGTLIGHELTHGFDNNGRRYDSDGNVRNWWTNSSSTAFEHKTKCFREQYTRKMPEYGFETNGNLTLGENIGDNGGVRIAYDTAQKSGHLDKDAPEAYGNMTRKQMFFLSFANVYCTKSTLQYKRTVMQNDAHSLEELRVNGVVSNMAEFAAAFKCPIGSAMNPKKKCKIW